MFDKQIYKTRRENLKQNFNTGVLIFLGNTESSMNYPNNTYHFRQDSNFSYFTGLELPNLALIIDIDNNRTTLYGDDFDVDDIIWMGPQPSITELALKSDIKSTKPYKNFDEDVLNFLKNDIKIHYLPPYRAETKIHLNRLLDINFENLKNEASEEFIKAVISLREVKSDFEVSEIEKACEIGYKMQTTAMLMCKVGKYESQLAGTIEGIAISEGNGVSFPVILSQNGETLHNHDHSKKLENGKLLLIDCGAELKNNYCSDYTRTIPVSGKFSEIQKQIYNIVLKANLKAIEAVKPNERFIDIHLLACKVIAEGLIEVGIMKGNADDAVRAGAHTLFFPHGLGHMLGMDVHDMEGLGENLVGYNETTKRSTEFGTAFVRMGKELKKGFVVTIEPGIYFIPTLIDLWKKDNKLSEFINYETLDEYRDFGGIRIEDDILVTDNGFKVIGKAIPKSVEEIENLMKNN